MQEDFLEEAALAMQACFTFSFNGTTSAAATDPYTNGFESLRNLLCQLNSIHRVTRLWRTSGHVYDAVLYLRPDQLFNCPFPVDVLQRLQQNTLYVADFHHWGGLNDRFALGVPATVALWGERCASPLLYCTASAPISSGYRCHVAKRPLLPTILSCLELRMVETPDIVQEWFVKLERCYCIGSRGPWLCMHLPSRSMQPACMPYASLPYALR